MSCLYVSFLSLILVVQKLGHLLQGLRKPRCGASVFHNVLQNNQKEESEAVLLGVQ